MKRFYKLTAITLAGIGALAIAASPGLAGGESKGAGEVAPRQGLAGMMTPPVLGQTAVNMNMMGPGMIGPGMMGPAMMGSGMMGLAMLPAEGTDLNLSVADVRGQIDQSLTWHGNKRIKAGEVTAVDDNTIVADVVTLDGSLVQRFEIDRHTGAMLQTE